MFSDPHRQALAQADDVVHLPGNDEHRQRRNVADKVHATRHVVGAYQVDRYSGNRYSDNWYMRGKFAVAWGEPPAAPLILIVGQKGLGRPKLSGLVSEYGGGGRP